MDVSEIDQLKIRMRKFFPLKGIEQKVSLAVILLFASGIALSISVKDWQYLAGSGSLIVILGIYVAWRDIAGRVQWFENVAKQTIRKELTNLQTSEPRGLIAHAQREAVETKLEDHSKSLDELFALLRRRLRSLEAATLIFGTFISGYGTIIGTFMHKFNV